ncbi:TonB-dependent receptor [Alteromonas gilva]|uniref:TonB-dependent receptor n=1 Tax=Alteromonas gilva TaxID=2987522 RepID=A0ABT5KXQ2_9ALTE|nr:TonB-dependent receptor [Alteromonas gilva]MDC8829531.1 TonB-dependent receptor [Alteromonas gilva]
MKYSILCLSLLSSFSVFADGPHIERVVVFGKQSDLVGDSISASEGVIGAGDIERRPLLRAGEVLEFVPGMVVTQHSGSGKANQYFLRGFNLDHGTDFSINIDGMPVNMRTHGHGQGYSDLNFITPEFIQQIDYQKGPYRATQGDFSVAGSANFALVSAFNQPFAKVELGENGFLRSVAATNLTLGQDNLAVGAEWQTYDGPWTDIDEDINKKNVFVRYRQDNTDSRLHITFMGYDNSWNAADQIPRRAVQSGLIDELGSIDTTLGGESDRYSLSLNWQSNDWLVNAYAVQSNLNLFSNFTYFLDNPDSGDQFEQVDDRQIYGGTVMRFFSGPMGSAHVHVKTGIDFRIDNIDEVGLYRTSARVRQGAVRVDNASEYSVSAFYEADVTLTNRLSAHAGIRHDYLSVDVNSDIAANSGEDSDTITSLKGGISYIIDDAWQAYFNLGQSFHSNDARGAVISIDPVSGDAAEPVDMLVRGEGAELGLRVAKYRQYNASWALWYLENDSELLFVGDAGNTEASRASRRWGVEFSAYYWFTANLTTDLEIAWTESTFTEDEAGEGNYIDGSLPVVASLGLNWQMNDNWRTDVRVRYFGKRTLDSFKQRESDTFTVVNTNLVYETGNWQASVSVLNVFDSNDHDIDYLYASRLPGEPEDGVEDVHYHPIEPRMLRGGISYKF